MATSHALLIGIERYPHIENADLGGPGNDLLEIAGLLSEPPFSFPDANFDCLFEEEDLVGPPVETTRDKIVAAFERLCGRVGKDDVVVIYYSGHGSWVERDGRRIETIVPADSGRAAPHGDGTENRDVEDHEISGWIERLNRETPYVTLIFDSCHSGSINRDPFATGVREVVPDRRPPVPARPLPATRSLDSTGVAASAAGPVVDHGRTVLLAACRADEEAKEYQPTEGGVTYAHGAFTYHLVRALKDAPAGATWRGLFETVAPRVTALYGSQHPQVEGRWDTAVFGVEEYRPRAYLPVTAVDGDTVTLAGGVVHGLAAGALWSLHPASATHLEEGSRLARLEVETVAPAASVARVVEAGEGARPETGQRAFLLAQRARPELTVTLDAGGAPEKDQERLQRKIDRAGLLRVATEDSVAAAVVVRYLVPRTAAEAAAAGAPCPLLGALAEPTWAAVAGDGRLAVRHRPAAQGVSGLVADVEQVARYRGLLAVDNPAAGNPLAGRVEMTLQRWRDGAFVDLESEPGDGLPRLTWGEGLEVLIASRHEAPLWVTLLVFSCDFEIDQLLPSRDHPDFRPGGYKLKPGQRLAVATDYGSRFRIGSERGLAITWPEDFPWATESGAAEPTALYHLKLMVTTGPADFEFVCQERTRDPGVQANPALELARLYHSGAGSRDVPAAGGEVMGWTTLTRSLSVGDRP